MAGWLGGEVPWDEGLASAWLDARRIVAGTARRECGVCVRIVLVKETLWSGGVLQVVVGCYLVVLVTVERNKLAWKVSTLLEPGR